MADAASRSRRCLFCVVMRSPSSSPRRLVAIGLSTGDGDGAVAAGVPPWRGSSESGLFVLGLVNSKFDIGCQPDPEPMPRQRGRPARYGSMGGRDKIPDEFASGITVLAARHRRRSEPCGSAQIDTGIDAGIDAVAVVVVVVAGAAMKRTAPYSSIS